MSDSIKRMKKVVMIAGGGTGGHIYPGIAIARALLKLDADVEIHFVGTNQGLETKIIPKENFPLHLIAGGKLNFSGNPILKIKTLLKLPLGFIQSIGLILKFQPFVVLGVGGYASGPFLLAAALMGRNTAIWEANALPGMANRWLSRFVKKCFLVFEESKKHLSAKNIQVLGMPVRAELEIQQNSSGEKVEATSAKQDGKFHLLHYGGSQGSRAIGRALCAALQQKGPWVEGLQVVHQTGSLDFQDFQKRYQGYQNLVQTFEFIYDMPQYYRWADLVLCRGGASTLSELAAFGLPAIVIPLPAADGHQEKNAEVLVKGNAAKMILQSQLTPERVIQEIENLRGNPQEMESMRQNIRKFHRPKAAEAIAKSLLQT